MISDLCMKKMFEYAFKVILCNVYLGNIGEEKYPEILSPC
jgi:hypothetical protein